MKYLLLLSSLFINDAHAYKVLSEKTWVSGGGNGYTKQSPLGSDIMRDVARATTFLVDQFGYQGIINTISSKHTFYIYNSSGITGAFTCTAKLCDQNDKCVHFEKIVQIKWKETYGETIYSFLDMAGINVGREPIYAETALIGYPSHSDRKDASFLLAPFPYDP
ncbi:MAG: hypothetical protein H0U73_04305 [Tatlockia sp.]|nr:hypothetical protein [Tatlockia sp.]